MMLRETTAVRGTRGGPEEHAAISVPRRGGTRGHCAETSVGGGVDGEAGVRQKRSGRNSDAGIAGGLQI